MPEETPLPGSSKGTTQKRKADLVKARAPLRRFITRLHVNLIELINQEGSRSFLKKKMLECEQSWEQCRKLDQLVLNMISEQEGEEAEKKEEDVQYEYEVKMEELREASEKYLEKRIMEPPSLAGSVAESVIERDINIEERNRIPEEIGLDSRKPYMCREYPSPVLHQRAIEQQIPLLPTSGSDVGQQVENAELKHHLIYHHSDWNHSTATVHGGPNSQQASRH